MKIGVLGTGMVGSAIATKLIALGHDVKMGSRCDDSLGEQVQRAFPDTKAVKTLNTVNCQVMVDPSRIPGDHDIFISGNQHSAWHRDLV